MTNIRQWSLICALLFAGALAGLAQSDFDTERLNAYFNALEESNRFMGSAAVSKGGEIIYTRAIGYADMANNVKATENTKYRIGSISKTFTAVLVLKAVEEEKLSLNQTIDKWFPSITNANKITVQHLLNHRSGIYSFTNDEKYLTWNTEPKTEEELIEIIKAGGSVFEPDSKAEYSNSNYLLLTYLLEKTFSESYADLLQEHIVQPIGLTSTYVFGKIDPANDECRSYTFKDAWIEEPETDYTIPLGAGAITSTPSELTKFADALFGGKLLSNESLETMMTMNEGYGMGLFQFPFFNSTGYGHTGGIDGFSSIFSHFPEEKVSYALISNGSNYNNNDISMAVLSAVFGRTYEIPSFEAYEVSAEDLDQYLGVYASEQIPLIITVTKEGSTLIAQGTGQPALPLEATAKDTFEFSQAGARFVFNPADQTMVLFQGGGQIQFAKE
jgi:CubicO group peptidase (beta-lactamase class C family)